HTPVGMKDGFAPDKGRLVAKLADQTGLRFDREPRVLKVLYMVDTAPALPSPKAFEARYGLTAGERFKRVLPPFGPERQAYWNALPSGGAANAQTHEWDGSARGLDRARGPVCEWDG